MTHPMARTLQTSTLRDGTAVRVREQTDGDRALLAALFEGLTPRSRYLRFMAGVPAPLPARLLDILAAADGRRHVGVIAVHRGRAVGAARYICAADGAREAARALASSFGASLRSDGHTTFAVLRTHPAAEPVAV
jgi:hypothetical protein